MYTKGCSVNRCGTCIMRNSSFPPQSPSIRQRKETGLLLLPDATVPFSSEDVRDFRTSGCPNKFSAEVADLLIKIGYEYFMSYESLFDWC